MYISKMRVKDYKSFRDSGEIEFKPGINLIVGQNNSGKTALLEALELEVKQKVHESEKTKPSSTSRGNTNRSFTESTIIFKADEIKQILSHSDFSTFSLIKTSGNVSDAASFQANIGEDLIINFENRRLSILSFGSYQEDNSRNSGNTIIYLLLGKNGQYRLITLGDSSPQSLASLLRKYLFKNIYRFYAERMNIGYSLIGTNRDLNPDASNLAEVLHATSSFNSALYQKFINLVNEVIPSVKAITSTMREIGDVGSLNYEIKIWTIHPSTEREDLAIPLSDCGTGISQVLAIIYSIVTSKQPKIIIIDEPNSFLHPGAAKKLIQILNKKEYNHHQYFVSTHSPEILSAAKPSTITRLKYVDGETIAESINLKQTKDLRETLSEIGVRFSDVFFAENILWVEGPTEAEAFPLILEKEKELFDVIFLPLVNTGDLREKKQARKNAKLAFEIYRRLSGEHALTPPFVAVIFDKEEENKQEVKELEKISEGKAKFIPRRMFENYLLDSEAIVAVYNKEPELAENKKVSIEKVGKWIATKRKNKEYLSEKIKKQESIENKEWYENVDGARLLEDLFRHLQGNIEYRKTTHSIKLTEWLLENKPEQLKELKDFLIELIENQN